jgi:hypothetical protein
MNLEKILGPEIIEELIRLCVEYSTSYQKYPLFKNDILKEFQNNFSQIIYAKLGENLTPEEIIEIKHDETIAEFANLFRELYDSEIQSRINARNDPEP